VSERIFPVRNPSVVAREIENECILYAPEAKMVYVVNATARDVWNLCDGKHDLEKIVSKVYEEYDVEMNVLERDVRKIISDLEKVGLLSCSREPSINGSTI
jgi:hypothetical protein